MSNYKTNCCSTAEDTSAQVANGQPVTTPVTESVQTAKVFVPQVDIVESDDRILLVADLPGVDEQGLNISLKKNILTLQGKVSRQVPVGYELYHGEYQEGNFERTFTVSNDIDREGIEALLKDGVLRLSIPKAKHATVQKIPVKTA